jgi:tetratricopeptide (TPR) repeat protein
MPPYRTRVASSNEQDNITKAIIVRLSRKLAIHPDPEALQVERANKDIRECIRLTLRDSASVFTACVVVDSWTSGFQDTLSRIQSLAQEILVVNFSAHELVNLTAKKFGACLVPCRPTSKGRADTLNLALEEAQGTWILWLEPGEIVREEDLRKLAEIARVDRASLPSSFAVEVHTPGIGPHRDIDVRIHDAFRLHQKSDAIRYGGRFIPLLDLRVDRFGLDDPVWADIVIHQNERFHFFPARWLSLDDVECRFTSNGTTGQLSAYEYFWLGEHLAESARYDQAIDYLHRSITNDTEDRWYAHKAYSVLIHALTQQGRYDEAEP